VTAADSFARMGKGPIIGPSASEPYLQACPIVRRQEGGRWHMWYLSGTAWLEVRVEVTESMYVVMHATSRDGINWERDGKPVMPARVDFECQTSASVFEHQGRHHMLFSYRHGLDFRNADARLPHRSCLLGRPAGTGSAPMTRQESSPRPQRLGLGDDLLPSCF
jgi:hypothetical protein